MYQFEWRRSPLKSCFERLANNICSVSTTNKQVHLTSDHKAQEVRQICVI